MAQEQIPSHPGEDEKDRLLREARERIEMLEKKNEGLMGLAERNSERLQEEYDRAETHREDAQRDPTTGLFNPRGLEGEFEVLSKAERPTLSLLLLDVDHFKKINDTYGHKAGDEVLKAIAAYLQSNLREDDVVARSSERGDEFIILIKNAQPESFIRKFQDNEGHDGTMGLTCSVTGDDGESATVHVGFSGGLVTIRPGEHLKDAMGRADKALYSVKNNGRNKIVIAEDAPTSSSL